MLLLLLLASVCVATNWAVIFSTDDIVAASCSTSRSCRLYDYLVSSGVNRKNIIFMSPKLNWDSSANCEPAYDHIENVVDNPLMALPYGDICWSHLNYVGDFVDFSFLMDVLRGDKESVLQKSNIEPVVVEPDEDSNVFIYYENQSEEVPEISERLYTKMDFHFRSMIWLTDASVPIFTAFDQPLLDSGCLILNLRQTKDVYGFFVYAPNYEPFETLYRGMWDHSWIDMIIFMNDYNLESVVMAATAGLLQMQSPEHIGMWGDELLLDMPVAEVVGTVPSGQLLHSFRRTKETVTVDDMKIAIRETFFTNKNQTKHMHYYYFSALKREIKQRKRAWNTVLMSELKEDPSLSVSDEECVLLLVRTYYQDCLYAYPFDNMLMQLVRSLCHFRKSEKMIRVNQKMFCGLNDLNADKIYKLDD